MDLSYISDIVYRRKDDGSLITTLIPKVDFQVAWSGAQRLLLFDETLPLVELLPEAPTISTLSWGHRCPFQPYAVASSELIDRFCEEWQHLQDLERKIVDQIETAQWQLMDSTARRAPKSEIAKLRKRYATAQDLFGTHNKKEKAFLAYMLDTGAWFSKHMADYQQAFTDFVMTLPSVIDSWHQGRDTWEYYSIAGQILMSDLTCAVAFEKTNKALEKLSEATKETSPEIALLPDSFRERSAEKQMFIAKAQVDLRSIVAKITSLDPPSNWHSLTVKDLIASQKKTRTDDGTTEREPSSEETVPNTDCTTTGEGNSDTTILSPMDSMASLDNRSILSSETAASDFGSLNSSKQDDSPSASPSSPHRKWQSGFDWDAEVSNPSLELPDLPDDWL